MIEITFRLALSKPMSLSIEVVVFLTPTKSLIKQFKKYITQAAAGIKVGVYYGECYKIVHKTIEGNDEEKVNIMSWDAKMWQDEAAEVLYMSHIFSINFSAIMWATHHFSELRYCCQ